MIGRRDEAGVAKGYWMVRFNLRFLFMLLDFYFNYWIRRKFLFNGFRHLMREVQSLKASDSLFFTAQINSPIQLHSSARSGLVFLQTIAVFVSLFG